jgi:plasmid maintenance system antidote protein VapI
MSNIIFLHHQEIRKPTGAAPEENANPRIYLERRRAMRTQAEPTPDKQERKVTQCGEVIGWNIQRILKNQGMSQSELARKMGTQPSVINEICNGKRNLSVNRLDKIRAILGVNCYEFLMPPVKPG